MVVEIKEYESAEQIEETLDRDISNTKSTLGEYLRRLDEIRSLAEKSKKIREVVMKLAGKKASGESLGEISFKVTDDNTFGVKEKKEAIPKKNISYSDVFEDAWKEYDRKGSKKVAWQEFLKLDESDQNKLIPSIFMYKSEQPDKQFRKDFQRFLRYDLYTQYYDLFMAETSKQEKIMKSARKPSEDHEWWD